MVVLIFFALMVAAFWFLIIRPQRKQLAAHKELIASLAVGDEVITNSGIYGTIDAIDEATVELEISEDVVVRVARSAITQRLGDQPEVDLDDQERASDEADVDGLID